MSSGGDIQLAKAYVQIIPTTKGIKGGLEGVFDDDAKKSGEKAGESFSSALGATIKKLVVALGIGKIIASAFSEGAALQQSLGGVETLFKDSADKVKNYALVAYRTSGMSANAYMENVTAFSASLISSLGGDTEKAAELANTAMIDMSDNANKMGTNMESITQTYQSLARGNYAMLDNLKLGYGGTKQEMQRLMKDAEKLTGEHYTVGDFGDTVKAIHAIQDSLGITGTTAKEAATTFSGSFNQMKAAGLDLLGALTTAPDAVGEYVATFADTASVFIKDNLFPMIGNLLQSLPEFLGALTWSLGPMLPGLLEGAASLLKQLAAALIDYIPSFFGDLGSAFGGLATGLGDIAPLVLGIAAAFGALKVEMMIAGIITAVTESWNKYRKANEGATIAQWLFNGALNANPLGVIIAVIAGAVAAIVALWNTNEQFRNMVAPLWEGIKNTVGGAIAIIGSTLSAIGQSLMDLWAQVAPVVAPVVQAIGQIIVWLVQAALLPMQVAMDAIGAVVTAVWNNISVVVGPIVQFIGALIVANFLMIQTIIEGVMWAIQNVIIPVWNAISGAVGCVVQAIFGTVSSVFNTIAGFISAVFGGIKNTAVSIWEGIKNAIVTPIMTARDIIRGIVDAIKGFFKFEIHFPPIKLPHFSVKPSGWQIGDLLKGSIPSLGIEWYAKAMDRGMILSRPTIFGAAGGHLLAGGEAGAEVVVGKNSLFNMIQRATGSRPGGDITVNIYAKPGQDTDALADAVVDKILAMRRKAVM